MASDRLRQLAQGDLQFSIRISVRGGLRGPAKLTLKFAQDDRLSPGNIAGLHHRSDGGLLVIRELDTRPAHGGHTLNRIVQRLADEDGCGLQLHLHAGREVHNRDLRPVERRTRNLAERQQVRRHVPQDFVVVDGGHVLQRLGRSLELFRCFAARPAHGLERGFNLSERVRAFLRRLDRREAERRNRQRQAERQVLTDLGKPGADLLHVAGEFLEGLLSAGKALLKGCGVGP